MKTNNPKIIGIVMLLVGLAITGFWGFGLFKIVTYPFTGTITQAKVIGYKVSRNGARMVKNNRSLSGKSPFFEFITNDNQTIKSYSQSPQIFVLFNYQIDEKIEVAYPKNEPKKAVIISWKEIPGLVLMIAIGILAVVVGKSYMFKKQD